MVCELTVVVDYLLECLAGWTVDYMVGVLCQVVQVVAASNAAPSEG